MSALKDLISSILSLKFEFGKKSNEIIINTDELKKGYSKIVPVWSWRKMRHIKYVISYNGGKIEIEEIK